MAAITISVVGMTITYVTADIRPGEVLLGGGGGGTGSTIMNDPWSGGGYDYDPVPDFKLLDQPDWLKEQRQTPRRMKRPFPVDKPGPKSSRRRGAY